MPIRIPSDLPAHDVLKREGVMVMAEEEADRQDIRPLHIGLLNLMPMKEQTETQIARLVGAGPLQIELTLVKMTDHFSKNTSLEHMEAFYLPFVEARQRKFDGFIITGAPIEQLEFGEVTYWRELEEVFEWTATNVHATMAICWGAQALLRHRYGVPKHALDKKAFGCFRHRVVAPSSPYLTGFADHFVVPVSRWTETRAEDLPPEVNVLVESKQSGICLVEDAPNRTLCIFNHFEYDKDTLKQEYDRDAAKGDPIEVPVNYYPGDDPTKEPENRWRSHAHLLFGNWINQIYQTTPYDIDLVGR